MGQVRYEGMTIWIPCKPTLEILTRGSLNIHAYTPLSFPMVLSIKMALKTKRISVGDSLTDASGSVWWWENSTFGQICIWWVFTLFSLLIKLSCRHQGCVQIRLSIWKSLKRLVPVLPLAPSTTDPAPTDTHSFFPPILSVKAKMSLNIIHISLQSFLS